MSISDEFDAWAAEQDELARLDAQVVYELWLHQFECKCGECVAIRQFDHVKAVRWVGPCAEESWLAWRGKYSA